jgi:hypothetical protein
LEGFETGTIRAAAISTRKGHLSDRRNGSKYRILVCIGVRRLSLESQRHKDECDMES